MGRNLLLFISCEDKNANDLLGVIVRSGDGNYVHQPEIRVEIFFGSKQMCTETTQQTDMHTFGNWFANLMADNVHISSILANYRKSVG